MTDELCEVVITAPDADWLADFTRRLVVDHLCSSVHIIEPVRSLYEWRGQLVDRAEARASVRTRTTLVARIAERLDRDHPYEVPGIVALPIVASSSAYRMWIPTRPSLTGHRAKRGHPCATSSALDRPPEGLGPGLNDGLTTCQPS
jgi:periplasmic divalent cation tolerance protein